MEYTKNISLLLCTTLLSFSLCASVIPPEHPEYVSTVNHSPQSSPTDPKLRAVLCKDQVEKKNLIPSNRTHFYHAIQYAQTPDHFDAIEDALRNFIE